MAEKKTKEAKNGNSISFLSSIKFKILALTSCAVILTVVVMLIRIVPTIQKDMKQTVQNYMYDMAKAYGESVEIELRDKGEEYLANYEELSGDLGDVAVKGVSSSYAYLVSGDGIMLYHPTQDKVGSPVENEAVKGVVSTIASGKHPETAVVEYLYKGAMKYAAYYVDEDNSAILVVTADEDDIMASIKAVTTSAYIIGIVMLLVCIGISILMAKMITDPIIKVSKSVEKIGDLDFTADETLEALVKRKDENGAMARGISKVQAALVDVVVTLKEQAENIRLASDTLEEGTTETTTTIEQVEIAVTEIADGATSQAGETQKATENVILMGNLVEDNSQEIQVLIDNARAMRSSSEEAAATLQTLEEINRSAVESIAVIAEQTNTTNESAQKIREATDLITSIAEETNLLSLNASIEAARAGEQGRGFAVVASQIQKLAEQSNESAHQIETVIDTLIADSQKAVETMSQVEAIMNKQNDNVALTEKKFKEVANGISTSVDSIRIIRDKSNELDGTRVAVVDIVQNLTAIAEENAASTEETSASVTEVTAIVNQISEKAAELKQIADELDANMQIFKI